jgi:MFS family permease
LGLNPFRGLPGEVPALVGVAFCVALGFGIVAPALPVFARDFGVGNTAAGAVVSVFAATRLVSAPVAGRVVNRFGERLAIGTGISVVAVSSVLAGLAGSYLQLLVLRGAGGIGSVMFTVGSAGLMLRVVGPEQRGRAMGLWSGGFLLGAVCGPSLGSVVTRESVRAPFFLYAATLAVAGSVALIALRHTVIADRTRAATGYVSLREAVRLPAYRTAVLTNFTVAWAVLGVRATFIPLFVRDALHRDPVWTGIGFTLVSACNMALVLPTGRWTDRHGRKPALLAGLFCIGLGMAGLSFVPGLVAYLVATVLLGLGSGMLDVVPASILGDALGDRAGSAVAAYQMAGDTGAIVGPVLGGRLADNFGPRAPFVLSTAILATATALACVAPETRRPVAHSDPK